MSVIGDVKMSIFSTVRTAFDMGATKAVFTSSQANRISWRELLSNAILSKQPDLAAPYVVVHFGGDSPADWSMDGDHVTVPLDVFYIANMRDVVRSTLSAGAASSVQSFVSVSNIFAGQLLHFERLGLTREVVSIAGLDVTLDSTITTTTGDVVTSDIEDDVRARCQALRTALRRGLADGKPYALVEDPTVDVSAENVPNRVFLEMATPLHAGQVSTSLLVTL